MHPDQTGFIKRRYGSDNIQRLFNIINLSQQTQTKTIIMSLDEEKAFDQVNWIFLLNILHKFDFGESFIHWIKTVYTSAKATVTTNGITSKSFTIHWGTRQGCPLSPILFAIFIEPFAAAIHHNNAIKEVHTTNLQHKISF